MKLNRYITTIMTDDNHTYFIIVYASSVEQATFRACYCYEYQYCDTYPPPKVSKISVETTSEPYISQVHIFAEAGEDTTAYQSPPLAVKRCARTWCGHEAVPSTGLCVEHGPSLMQHMIKRAIKWS